MKGAAKPHTHTYTHTHENFGVLKDSLKCPRTVVFVTAIRGFSGKEAIWSCALAAKVK